MASPSANRTSDDPRPPVWIGHVVLATADVARANAYWTSVGMRAIESGESFAVLELRGGTHLVLVGSDAPVAAGTPCPFDLMVEDVDAAHGHFRALGLEPSELKRNEIHDSFTLVDPSGYVVTVNSSHVSDQPV
jgi:catechol 2,3-dioxygenase-like lactoylglutathione lyase family enzyme